MVGSVGDGVKHRFATFWDTTSIVQLALYGLLAAAIPIGVLWYLLGRDGGSGETATDTVAATEMGAGIAATTTTQAPPPELSELDPFFVVGDEIVDPYGNLFVPIGTNAAIRVADYPYVFDGGNGGVNGQVDAVKAWGWNTVRANLSCYDESGEPSQRQIIDGIDETVRELTEAGIVVILACHDATGDDPQLNGPLEVQVRAFWDEVVPKYADNPYVWFNFFNEPYTTDDTEPWVELHQFYYDRYRDQGVNNIMIFDLPLYGQGIHLAAEGEFVEPLGNACNTILGWHAWGSLSGVQATEADYANYSKAVTDRDLAVMIGEAGVPFPPSAGTAGNPEWNETGYYAALEVARSSNIGLLWWHGTGDTSDDLYYPLKVDKSGFWTAGNSGNLTIAGATFWDFSHRERQTQAFAGDLTDSGCAAAAELESNPTD
ncbi:MAG: glycoside hydrolase family 5 protein [Acidimicrobiia bacterium]|nr:glycoside hydrolase family 5 protein [Acidimicrobiia bacterium]